MLPALPWAFFTNLTVKVPDASVAAATVAQLFPVK
jgi:hypothetical protein